MKKITSNDLKNIINLFKDPDDKIFKLIEPQILENGSELFNDLKNEFDISDNFLVKKRLLSLIDSIYYSLEPEEAFRNIPSNEFGEIDLEEATLMLSVFGYPEMKKDIYKKKLDEMSFNIKQKLKKVSESSEVINIINDYLFNEEGFRGNREDYFNPDNSYLNTIIDKRRGIPISLSAIYLFITRRLGLPFFGVSMPGHFIVKYKDEEREVYIDPFHKGKILTKQDCITFLVFSGYGFNEKYLEVSTNKEIILRMIRNLLLIYQEKGDNKRHSKLKDILSIIETNY